MLAEIITRAQNYGIETKQNGNTNHLPMALIALEKLGANTMQLEAYYANYAPSLIARGSNRQSIVSYWKQELGNKSAFDRYLAYFMQEVEHEGIEVTLKHYLDYLMKGCGASAFHALIRLSYGIQVDNRAEVAFGLADLASNYFPVELPTRSELSLGQIVENALAKFDGVERKGSLISSRMMSVIQHDVFSKVNLIPELLALDELAELVAELYLQSRDFTVLHAVTSCHAMRYITPYLNQPTQSLRYYWTAVIAAILSVDNLRLSVQANNPLKPLSDLDLNVVLTSDDSHVIKLVWSCVDEYRYYGLESHLQILNTMLEGTK